MFEAQFSNGLNLSQAFETHILPMPLQEIK